MGSICVRTLLPVAVVLLSAASYAAGKPLERHTLMHEDAEREYFVHVPDSGEGPLPVVFAVHGYTSTATGFEHKNGLNRHADENGYIVVYPQGSHFVDDREEPHYRVTSWNDLAANQPPTDAGPHCLNEHNEYPKPPECKEFGPCAWTSCYDDLGLLEKIIDEVEMNYPGDPDRFYVLGVSNGGMMTLRLGCNLSDRFAAIAPIIGQLAPGYDCGPTSDLPMIHLFGGEDDTVPHDGRAAGDGFIYTSAEETAATWAQAMSCESGPADWSHPVAERAGLVCSAYSGCTEASHEVVSCLDPDGGHAWPEQYIENHVATCAGEQQQASMPGQPPCEESGGRFVHDGMDLIWDFFSRYSRPTAEKASP